ncbi:hypothetical protein M501DRAFT_1061155 [Patellaria atrata CBS 101060]|uniref:Uncharacterized protein n=1 Tax=Patellaria atrata CBS 101060 TaxID=1346257 RepID=A0A9P4VL57_9PEZI|nr:hypothetical protein M501DRAFT_1061155 [Patellaria atrata CBS 101060]
MQTDELDWSYYDALLSPTNVPATDMTNTHPYSYPPSTAPGQRQHQTARPGPYGHASQSPPSPHPHSTWSPSDPYLPHRSDPTALYDRNIGVWGRTSHPFAPSYPHTPPSYPRAPNTGSSNHGRTPHPDHYPFTPSQLQALAYLKAEGRTYVEIAAFFRQRGGRSRRPTDREVYVAMRDLYFGDRMAGGCVV